jgi:cell division transport system ATP-binding protein
MIEFSHVYKTYPGPVHALKNIDLKIDKGEFAFLTGPSGAGKTTLFKMISAYDVAW